MRKLSIDIGGEVSNLVFNNPHITWPHNYKSSPVPLIIGDINNLINNAGKPVDIVNVKEFIIQNNTSVHAQNYGMLKKIVIESGVLHLINWDDNPNIIEVIIKKDSKFTVEKGSPLNFELVMEEGAIFDFYKEDQYYKISSPFNNFIIEDIKTLISYASLLKDKFISNDELQFSYSELEMIKKYVYIDNKIVEEFIKQNFHIYDIEPVNYINSFNLSINEDPKENDSNSQSNIDTVILSGDSDSLSDSDGEG